MTSEWPLMYFVTECITISTPKSRGLHTQGVKKVLSTTILASELAFLTPSTILFMLIICRLGLEHTSSQTNLVLILTALLIFSGFEVETKVTETPSFCNCLRRFRIPPYRQLPATM